MRSFWESGWRVVSGSADARLRAVVVLARVDAANAHAARLLGNAQALTRELVLGTLRWQRTLDHILGPLLMQPLAKLDPLVRAALRVGLYEAQRLSTPAPVAVAEAVRVVGVLQPRARGLVNAVLRRAVGVRWPAPDDPDLPVGLRFSHPEWLVQRWRRLVGDERLEAILAANQEPAPVCVLAAEDTRELLVARGCDPIPHPWAPGVWVARRNAAAAVEVVAGGGGYALDPTAALVAFLAPRSAARAVDLTAAPGGKLLTLAAQGFEGWIAGADRSPGRVALLRRNLRGRGCTAALLVADATCPPLRPASFELVIVDAPCSGTGTLRRHPEIRWRLQEDDLVRMAAEQRRILRGALALVAPGGHLLYATCSLEPEENEQVIAATGWEPVPLAGRLPAGVPWLDRPGGGMIVLPSREGDGFSVAVLRRSA